MTARVRIPGKARPGKVQAGKARPDEAQAGQAHAALAARVLAAASWGARGSRARPLPSLPHVRALVDDALDVLFPGVGRRGPAPEGTAAQRTHVAGVLARLEVELEQAVFLGLHRHCPPGQSPARCRARARRIALRVLDALPGIRAALALDVAAAYQSDPAATGPDEIVACYPGLYAVAVYRVAHRLLREGAEVVPRMMTEHAHGRTGIDLHPGAVIGASFFIDHGTGIVVGETTIIGARVRIYQGVTLGALSVRRPGGARGPAFKRHPTIEDDVTIYANATILGGDTVIGRGAVVGGNAWITYSVPPGTRVGA